MIDMAEKKINSSNFGIHILKFLAIFFQIEVHAYNWLSHHLHVSAQIYSSVWETKLLLMKGGFSTLVPITAAAVLRMGLPLSPGQNKLPSDFSLRPYITLCFLLMLIESLKEMIVYGPWAFFSWNALHLIALTFLTILVVARYSVLLLWPLAAAIFLLTPLMIASVDNYIDSLGLIHPWLSVNLCFFLFLTLLATIIGWKYHNSKNIDQKIKVRGYTLLSLLWLSISLVCYFVPQQYAGQDMIRTLPGGILTGTAMGNHIWGFFPWAGMMIVGFLVYDILLRLKASKTCLWGMALIGAIGLIAFYIFFSDEVMDNCSGQRASLGFSALCFNRTPIQVVLTIALFLLATPFSVCAEKIGFEFKFVRVVSKSILWIYLYETSILVWLAPVWIQYIPQADRVYSFTIFALVSSAGIAILLDKFQYKLAVTLKKNER